jgi:1-acyl-sn-glycerol-3-phosphate acyltransferase
VFHELQVLTPCPLPDRGPAILVCNHTSGLDPLLIQSAARRRLIAWMMAREFYDMSLLNWVFRTVGAIPVERSGRDTAATRAALRALGEGRVLGIFPEGRIEPTRQLLPFQTGVAMMAIRTGVPVFPAYLDGTQRNREMLSAYLSSNRARIAFGEPVRFAGSANGRPDLQAATMAIQRAVAALQDAVESWRG